MGVITVYIDEDVSIKLARELRRRGYKTVTTQEAGQLEASDEGQLEYATAHGYAIVTYNQGDFARLHAQYSQAGRRHAGIIIASREIGLGETLRRLLRLLDSVSSEEMRGQMKWLSEYTTEQGGGPDDHR